MFQHMDERQQNGGFRQLGELARLVLANAMRAKGIQIGPDSPTSAEATEDDTPGVAAVSPRSHPVGREEDANGGRNGDERM